ncbi:MAG: 50S ribosomal protein L10 [Elusimicrobiota bacterium]
MLLQGKKEFVKNFAEELKDSKSIVLVGYQGLEVNALTELRHKLKEVNFTMKVVKNRLAIRSVDECDIESYSGIKDFLKGPTALLIGSEEDPADAIKIFKGYAKEKELMDFKAGVISDKLYAADQIARIADLPAKNVLIAQTVMMLNSPIQGLYNSLAGIIKKLCYAINDLKGKIETGEIKQAVPTDSMPDKSLETGTGSEQAATEADAGEQSEEPGNYEDEEDAVVSSDTGNEPGREEDSNAEGTDELNEGQAEEDKKNETNSEPVDEPEKQEE